MTGTGVCSSQGVTGVMERRAGARSRKIPGGFIREPGSWNIDGGLRGSGASAGLLLHAHTLGAGLTRLMQYSPDPEVLRGPSAGTSGPLLLCSIKETEAPRSPGPLFGPPPFLYSTDA